MWRASYKGRAAMKRPALAIAIGAAVLVSTQVSATDWKGRSLSSKRQVVAQVIDCMRKRMSSDRQISYNEAAKVCKGEVNRRVDTASSGPLVAADSPGK
jgi:hypothetical protein